ncbi:hypothetical protein ACR31S_08070 [Streptococcus iniae]
MKKKEKCYTKKASKEKVMPNTKTAIARKKGNNNEKSYFGKCSRHYMMGTTLLGTVGTVEAYQWNRGSLSSTERSLNQFKRDNIDRVKQYSITDKNKSRYEKASIIFLIIVQFVQ